MPVPEPKSTHEGPPESEPRRVQRGQECNAKPGRHITTRTSVPSETSTSRRSPSQRTADIKIPLLELPRPEDRGIRIRRLRGGPLPRWCRVFVGRGFREAPVARNTNTNTMRTGGKGQRQGNRRVPLKEESDGRFRRSLPVGRQGSAGGLCRRTWPDGLIRPA